MVRGLECECSQRNEARIYTVALFDEIKEFFHEQVILGIYEDIPVEKPYYIGISDTQTIYWYANKWYRCKKCGCLWEFSYPEFPKAGFVRKFQDGVYKERGE